MDWLEVARAREERYRDGEARLGDAEDGDARQRQLTRMGNAAGAAGLAHLMGGRPESAEWFARAAAAYRESWEHAPPGSWGRPIGALKALVLAGDWDGAAKLAAWPLEAGAATAESPIGRYAATLALLVLGRDVEARSVVSEIRDRENFPAAVADALATIAAEDRVGYVAAIGDVLASFEARDEYLEEMPVADTVLVLQALAARRELDVELRASPLLPSAG